MPPKVIDPESGLDETRSDAVPLAVRKHGHRPESEHPESSARRIEDDRCEQDVAGDARAGDGHEGDDGMPCAARGIDDTRFRGPAEGGVVHVRDRGLVAGLLTPDVNWSGVRQRVADGRIVHVQPRPAALPPGGGRSRTGSRAQLVGR